MSLGLPRTAVMIHTIHRAISEHCSWVLIRMIEPSFWIALASIVAFVGGISAGGRFQKRRIRRSGTRIGWDGGISCEAVMMQSHGVSR